MKELTIEASIENIEVITDFVGEQLEQLDCPMKIQMQFNVAIDEIVSNIANYAYHPENGPVNIKVEVESEPSLAVILTFTDNGFPFDPLAQAEPDITKSAEEREIGGLGIYLVKKSMDDISYEYSDGKNILKIKKAL